MMEEKDLRQIKEVFHETFAGVWDDNLEPAFKGVNKEIENVNKKIEAIKGQIAQLPTKSYLDDKLANLEGGLIAKLRKEDEKVNRLAGILKDKKVLSAGDIAELENLQVFPK